MKYIIMCIILMSATPAKKKTIIDYIKEADGKVSTTYGWGEWMCGDYGHPAPCAKGAITASGEMFHPDDEASAALFIPRRFGIYKGAVTVRLTLSPDRETGCVNVRINDKGNERYYGRLGFDLSKKALKRLLEEQNQEHLFKAQWMGEVYVCRS